jgi:hypothetical protein
MKEGTEGREEDEGTNKKQRHKGSKKGRDRGRGITWRGATARLVSWPDMGLVRKNECSKKYQYIKNEFSKRNTSTLRTSLVREIPVQ